MKYIFLSLLFLSCAHRPPAQYNDPEITRVESERRSHLIGKWLGESSILELTHSGEYLEKDLQGKVTGEGIWGISAETYFVLNKQKQSLYQNYQILLLNQSEFTYQNSKTKEKFHFKRLQEI